MSTWRCEVVTVGEITKHPNADTLSITNVFGYPTVVRTAEWAAGDLGVYIPPDSIVPRKYLAGGDSTESVRVRISKIRKLPSFGFLMKPPAGEWKPGDDAAEALGVTQYEPPVPIITDGLTATPPKSMAAEIKYDLENYRRWPELFAPGAQCYITEKIHGTNARFIWTGGELHIGTRTRWLNPGAHVWSRAAEQESWIVGVCERNPDTLFVGEVFGQVQDLKYGMTKGGVALRIFDAWKPGGAWLPYQSLLEAVGAEHLAPLIFSGGFDPTAAMALAEQPSALCGEHGREGVVIECSGMVMPFGGPSKLKHVSDWYLNR